MSAVKKQDAATESLIAVGENPAGKLLNFLADARDNLGERPKEFIDCPLYAAVHEDGTIRLRIVRTLTKTKTLASVGFAGKQRMAPAGQNENEALFDDLVSLRAPGVQLPKEHLVAIAETIGRRLKLDSRGWQTLAKTLTIALAARSGAVIEGREL